MKLVQIVCVLSHLKLNQWHFPLIWNVKLCTKSDYYFLWLRKIALFLETCSFCFMSELIKITQNASNCVNRTQFNVSKRHMGSFFNNLEIHRVLEVSSHLFFLITFLNNVLQWFALVDCLVNLCLWHMHKILNDIFGQNICSLQRWHN